MDVGDQLGSVPFVWAASPGKMQREASNEEACPVVSVAHCFFPSVLRDETYIGWVASPGQTQRVASNE